MCSESTYFLERDYVSFLKHISADSESCMTSTEDFIQKNQHIQFVNNYIMASHDIVSLFPSIDTHEVCNRICNDIGGRFWWNKKGVYFTSDDKYYKQNYGALTASPNSSIRLILNIPIAH